MKTQKVQLFTSDTLAGVKNEHFFEQVHGTTRHGWKPSTEVLLGVLWELSNISPRIVTPQKPQTRVIWRAYQLFDTIKCKQYVSKA